MPDDPLQRFQQLLSEARQEIARVSYEQPGRTAADVVEAVGRMRVAEGMVLDYLDALLITRPDLALEAIAEAKQLRADVSALWLTMPGGRPGEPWSEED